jgi:dihydrofolate reductase
MIRHIAAIDAENGLAKKGGIPWKLPTDVKYFREMTKNGTILMGQKTFDQIGVMKDRQNIVVSRRTREQDGVSYINDPVFYLKQSLGDVWVIGGGTIYKQTLELADELYLTQVKGTFGCDVFYPAYQQLFALSEASDWHKENGLEFRFEVWVKK